MKEEKVPNKTPGIPEINIKKAYFICKLFFFKCKTEAPKPKATLATLCVAKAFENGRPKNNRAGSCIKPAPPPDKAEIKLEKRDTNPKKI